jgi:hypothetical protein
MNASGGYSKKGLKETLEKFKTILPAYIYKNSN